MNKENEWIDLKHWKILINFGLRNGTVHGFGNLNLKSLIMAKN